MRDLLLQYDDKVTNFELFDLIWDGGGGDNRTYREFMVAGQVHQCITGIRY